MKFLLFNVAVAGALVFLFTADRGEVQKIAGRVHDAAGDMKAYANKTLNRGPDVPDRKLESAPVAAPPMPLARPAATPPQPSTQPPAEPPLSRQLARNLPAMPEIGSETGPEIRLETSKAAPADLNPAVAKRRREVLDGIDAADAKPALKEGTRLMSHSKRRKELLSLAEEMELLYARSISQ